MNNFQRLQKEDEERYKPQVERIRSDLNESMELYRFIGNIVEVYVPRFFDTLVASSGGGKVRNRAPHEMPSPSFGRSDDAPGGPSDLDPGDR